MAAQHPVSVSRRSGRALGNFEEALAQLGKSEESLATALEVVSLYRQLAAEKPDRHTQNLVWSLGMVGYRLINLKRHEEAVPVSEEAVARNRQMAAKQARGFLLRTAVEPYTAGLRPHCGGPLRRSARGPRRSREIVPSAGGEIPEPDLNLAWALGNRSDTLQKLGEQGLGIRLFCLAAIRTACILPWAAFRARCAQFEPIGLELDGCVEAMLHGIVALVGHPFHPAQIEPGKSRLVGHLAPQVGCLADVRQVLGLY